MFNQSGISKVSAASPVQILFNTQFQMSVGISVAQGDVVANDEGKKIIKAGTPVTGSLDARTTPFSISSTTVGTKGTWTCEITTAFATDEKIKINGVEYTCGATESETDKVFAGANVGAQATSLVNIVNDPNFVLTNSSGVLTFTQKVADESGSAPTVTKTATTGAIGTVTAGTSPVDGDSNAVGVLLHDVDVTAGNANGTLLIFGFVNTQRVDSSVKAMITGPVKKALNAKVTFIDG